MILSSDSCSIYFLLAVFCSAGFACSNKDILKYFLLICMLQLDVNSVALVIFFAFLFVLCRLIQTSLIPGLSPPMVLMAVLVLP